MKQVVNVHRRRIAARVDAVGAVLDSLGGPEDLVWPAEAWPTTPFVLEGALEAGTVGRQGALVQVVEEHLPGRRLAFRFTAGQGLVGGHAFDLAASGAEGTTVAHRLECSVAPRLRPMLPILLRQHDALVEDLFDRLELATTGRVARPATWPPTVRLANAVELRLQRLRHRVVTARSRDAERPVYALAATAVPGTLGALAALHAAWALGWRWPGGDDEVFAERIIGYGAGVPPAAATWAVAGLLAGAAVVVRRTASPGAPPHVRTAAVGVGVVFLMRGALSIAVDLVRGFDEVYERLDISIYSPLCLAIAGGIAFVVWPRPSAATAS